MIHHSKVTGYTVPACTTSHFGKDALVFLFCVLCVFGWNRVGQGQSFDQITRPVAIISRPAQIDSIFTELLIPLPDSVTHINVLDVTGNGFGPDDMIIVYPDLTVYPLDANIPLVLRDMMKSWELSADYRLDITLAQSSLVEADAHLAQDVRGAISGACISAIERYYSGTDLDIRLQRNMAGLRLEMWNYDPAALQYKPPLSQTCLANTDDTQIRIQQFRFATPVIVTSFNDPGSCTEVHHIDGRTETRPCQ